MIDDFMSPGSDFLKFFMLPMAVLAVVIFYFCGDWSNADRNAWLTDKAKKRSIGHVSCLPDDMKITSHGGHKAWSVQCPSGKTWGCIYEYRGHFDSGAATCRIVDD